MKLSEYVRNVTRDPKYGNDLEWVRLNLHPQHLVKLEAELVAQALDELAAWLDEFICEDGTLYREHDDGHGETVTVPTAIRERATTLRAEVGEERIWVHHPDGTPKTNDEIRAEIAAAQNGGTACLTTQ